VFGEEEVERSWARTAARGLLAQLFRTIGVLQTEADDGLVLAKTVRLASRHLARARVTDGGRLENRAVGRNLAAVLDGSRHNVAGDGIDVGVEARVAFSRRHWLTGDADSARRADRRDFHLVGDGTRLARAARRRNLRQRWTRGDEKNNDQK
jgi:hypothetical protein